MIATLIHLLYITVYQVSAQTVVGGELIQLKKGSSVHVTHGNQPHGVINVNQGSAQSDGFP